MFEAHVAYLSAKAQEQMTALNFEAASETLSKWTKVDPSNTDAWIARANCFKELGRTVDALGVLTTASNLNPNNPNLLLFLCRFHWIHYNFHFLFIHPSRLVSFCAKAHRLNPGIQEARQLLLDVHDRFGTVYIES
ncbi:hypothetical protein HDU99_002834 [Rhizoclosmatium hyalinum]|nr:hypothetical protein HDU99_002834 [Rhizoclosmatium hyalinum]